MSPTFVVPSDGIDTGKKTAKKTVKKTVTKAAQTKGWPETFWGLKLGAKVRDVRRVNNFLRGPEGEAERRAM